MDQFAIYRACDPLKQRLIAAYETTNTHWRRSPTRTQAIPASGLATAENLALLSPASRF